LVVRLSFRANGGAAKAVESFAPVGGRVLGIATLAIGALIVVDILLEWRTADGFTAAATVVAVCAFVWLGLVRPSVVAYDDVLVLRNVLCDHVVPWHLVTGASISPMLTVETPDRAYRSSAVGITARDRRALRKAHRNAAEAAVNRAGQPTTASGTPLSEAPPGEYAVARIESLARKYADNSRDRTTVERRWHWREFAVIGVAVVVAVVVGTLG
jgi:hypothetical protein